ncbi:conserved Plasmodium protein, unknown function [Plasmodium sp. gorilla clade G2]|uniref:conserved Plasmodium protein, unknown function n=1 Tax=Plasmodium sp. gorilla clade G2 TaxID=880535 RepID=UPI000D21A2F8|nr:conserved Plasmodium protein, unknown function [Plasmodium sp. gorilla clade G2]SOV17639.1 conserved Plasmodium protein, unknown function [Plasmodium sp. gorilla clade G2]
MNENNVKEMNNKNENPYKKKGDEKLSETASYQNLKKSSYIDNLYNKNLILCEDKISYCDEKKKENTNVDEERKRITNVKEEVENNSSICKNVSSTKILKEVQKDKYNILDMKGKNNIKNNTSSEYIKTRSLQNVKRNSSSYSNDKTGNNNSLNLEDHKVAFSTTNGNSLSFDGIDMNNIKLNMTEKINNNNYVNDDDGDNNNYYYNKMNDEKNEKEEISFNIYDAPKLIGNNMENYILHDEDNYIKSSFDRNDFNSAIDNNDGLKQPFNIFNEEINSHDLRRKNKDIIANIEKSSRYYKEKKDSFLSTLKSKSHEKKELYSSNIYQAKDEEIMIQRILIEQNNNDDNVRNKIDSIEQTIEENRNVKYNKMLSNKTGNILKNQSDILQNIICEEENYSSSSTNVVSHMVNKNAENDSFNKRDYEITDDESMEENLIKNNKYVDDEFGEDKYLNDHIPSDELNAKISNDISSIPHIELSKDSLENTREKFENVRSNYGEDFIDIKIYDEDSEIDDIQNNELDYFWNNKDVSNILNKERNFVRTSFEGNNEEDEKNISNSEDCGHGVRLGLIDLPDFNIKKKKDKIIFPQMRRSRSDNIYKRKNIAHFINKRNTIDNLINNENMEISLSNNEYTHDNNNNNNNDNINNINNNDNNRVADKKEEQRDDMNIADKLDIIRKKLAINNNIDIDNINYERFDMYQVDFEKIGLNVSNLEKEEKYILLLYISEKKLEYVWNEREAFKRAHSNIKNFQVNQNKMRELKNEKRENSVLIDTQYFKSNEMKNYQNYNILNKKNKYNIKNKSSNNCSTNKTNVFSNIGRSISVTSSFDTCEKKNNSKDFSLLLERHKYNKMRNDEYDEKMNSDDNNDIINNDETLQDVGFFLPFYRRLLKKYETINKVVINNDTVANDVCETISTANNNIICNNIYNNNNNICNKKEDGDNSQKKMSNEKALFEKFLKSFISLFFLDECIDQFLNYYEDIKTSKNKDDALLRHSLCIEYMCNCFQDIYIQKDYIENEEKNFWFLHFSDIMKDIINNFIENENLVNKIRKIQIINNILKDEVKTYSIKVAHEDIYLDVSQNFIEDYENVIVSKDIGFFNIYMLDKNYKYNYHIYKKQSQKIKTQNSKDKNNNNNNNNKKYVDGNNQVNYSNSFWSYIFGYFNNIYNNWSQEKDDSDDSNDTDHSSYSHSEESLQKDIINSSNLVIQNCTHSDGEQSGDISMTTDDENYQNLEEQKGKNKNKNKSDIKNEDNIEHNILHKRHKQVHEEKVCTNDILLKRNKQDKNKEKYKNDHSLKSKDIKSVDTNIWQNDKVVDTNMNNNKLNNYMNNEIKFNSLERQEHILGSSTNIDESIIESNLSNVSFHNSENSNNIKLDDFYVVNKKEEEQEMKHNTTKDEEPSEMLNNNNNKKTNCCSNIHKNRNDHISSYQTFKCNNKKYQRNVANLVSFQYKGSLPKENINNFKKMNKNKNIIGCYFSSSDETLVGVHIKSDIVQHFVDTHFIMERCRKYNKQIKKSYVHILNAKTKQYLAVNLSTNKIIYTNKYDDTIYLDQYNEQHKISTYFQLQSISDMMKNILIEDIVQSVADILC